MTKPIIPRLHDVRIDNDYRQWMHELKARYHRSQIKASVKVNAEKLLFNWQLGRDLALRKAKERWGSGIVEQVSLDLQTAFPGEGFSARNVWYMKQWYLFYSEGLHQVGTDTADKKLKQLVSEIHVGDSEWGKQKRPISELGETPIEGVCMPAVFGLVPWGHHVEILKKCKSIDEALYYIGRTIDEGWSRSWLFSRIRQWLCLPR